MRKLINITFEVKEEDLNRAIRYYGEGIDNFRFEDTIIDSFERPRYPEHFFDVISFDNTMTVKICDKPEIGLPDIDKLTDFLIELREKREKEKA